MAETFVLVRCYIASVLVVNLIKVNGICKQNGNLGLPFYFLFRMTITVD